MACPQPSSTRAAAAEGQRTGAGRPGLFEVLCLEDLFNFDLFTTSLRLPAQTRPSKPVKSTVRNGVAVKSSSTHLDSVGNFALGLLFSLAFGLRTFGCLIMPFLGLNAQVDDGSRIKIQRGISRLPNPRLFIFIAVLSMSTTALPVGDRIVHCTSTHK